MDLVSRCSSHLPSLILLEVYIPALKGYVPTDILRTLRAFLEFCYIVRQDSHDTLSLYQLDDALKRFHRYREIFVKEGVRRPNKIPPRQHSLSHYAHAIRSFGSPNGLCSSITESKHIDAVKKPWRRSNRYEALGQMLTINNRNDQLRAAQNEFTKRGMFNGSASVESPEGGKEDEEAFDGPYAPTSTELASTIASAFFQYFYCCLAPHYLTERNVYLTELADGLEVSSLPQLVATYLQEFGGLEVVDDLQLMELRLVLFTSAVSTFYAPSDHSGVNGMRRERVYACISWRRSRHGRYDTVFLRTDPSTMTISDGLAMARVRQFFSFPFKEQFHTCALVEHFKLVGDDVDETTGMWVVRRDKHRSKPRRSVIPVRNIFRAAHLIPLYDKDHIIPNQFSHLETLDHYQKFFVNRFADYHTFETAI